MVQGKKAMYPHVNPAFKFHRDASGGRLSIGLQNARESEELNGYAADSRGGFMSMAYFAIDGFYVDVLSFADGTVTLEEIVERYVKDSDPVFGPVLADRAVNWALSMRGLLRWTEQPLSPARSPQVTGRRDAYYPQHAVIEITDRCNFSCEHCYIAAKQNVGSFMSIDTFATVVELLSANGVQVVELSGGECTIHPKFAEMLNLACSKFSLVSVLTNGYLLGVPGKVRDAIMGRDNVAVQVSIDGIERTHDLFRKHRHSFQRAVEAVRVCTEAGKPTRIATSISEGTLHEVPELVSLGRKLAPALHAFSPVAPFGRGCNVTDSALASAGTSRRLEEALKKAGYSGPGITQAGAPTAAGGVEQIRNCGAGHRTVAVDVKAGVRPCNFGDALGRLGNLLTDEYHEIFSGLKSFQLANAPRPGGVECVECDYFNFCQGCPSKAMSLVPRADVRCRWYERWFETETLPQVNGADLLGVCDSCRETQVSSRSSRVFGGTMAQERRRADD